MLTQRIGRNDPCPCRSGRKFKVCCSQRTTPHTRPLPSPVLHPRVASGDGATTLPQPRRTTPVGEPVNRVPVHYTYPEPFGLAECVYCFPVDRPVILTSGNVVRAGWLQPGAQFRLEDGGIGTVTAVEPAQLWEPPSRIPDAHGNYLRRVVGTIKHKGYVLIDVTFAGQKITGTPDHPWYSVTRKKWVPAESLRPGERLLNTKGVEVTVEAVSEPRYGLVELYNVEVEELHTFFVGVGQASALVHNGHGPYITQPALPMREVPIGQLKPIQSVAHGSPRPGLQKLTDAELLAAVRNPKKGDFLTVNTRTGTLVDGNGRAHELLRRAADPKSSIKPDMKVPVQDHIPDMSMFPDLP